MCTYAQEQKQGSFYGCLKTQGIWEHPPRAEGDTHTPHAVCSANVCLSEEPAVAKNNKNDLPPSSKLISQGDKELCISMSPCAMTRVNTCMYVPMQVLTHNDTCEHMYARTNASPHAQ